MNILQKKNSDHLMKYGSAGGELDISIKNKITKANLNFGQSCLPLLDINTCEKDMNSLLHPSTSAQIAVN